MSKNNGSGPAFWLDMPLSGFREWIDTNNEITEEISNRLNGG